MNDKTAVKHSSAKAKIYTMVFGHQSPGGESFIDFSKLVWPSDMIAKYGFENPSASKIISSKPSIHPNDVIIESSLGPIQSLMYNVTPTGIAFIDGYTTSVGQIYKIIVRNTPTDSVNIINHGFETVFDLQSQIDTLGENIYNSPNGLMLSELETVVTPPVGKHVLFPNKSGQLKKMDSEGVISDIGGGGFGDSSTIALIRAKDYNATLISKGNSQVFGGGGNAVGSFSLSSAIDDILLSDKVFKYSANGLNGQYDYMSINVIALPGQRGVDRACSFMLKQTNMIDKELVVCFKTIGGSRDGWVQRVFLNNSSNSKDQEFSFEIPKDSVSMDIGFQNLSTNVNASFVVDNICIKTNAFINTNTTVVDSIRLDGFSSIIGSYFKFTTITKQSNNNLYVDNTTYTKVFARKNLTGISITFDVSRSQVQNGINAIVRMSAAGAVIETYNPQQFVTNSTAGAGACCFVIDLNAGEYFSFTDFNNTTITNMKAIISCQDVSDNGVVIASKEGSSWTNGGNITITATTTSPTKGATRTIDEFWYKDGKDGEGHFWMKYEQTVAGATGTGDYLFTLPGGKRFDKDVVKFYTTVEGLDYYAAHYAIGQGSFGNKSAAFGGTVFVVPYDETRFRLFGYGVYDGNSNGDLGVVSDQWGSMANLMQYSVKFSAPIAGLVNGRDTVVMPFGKEDNYYIEASGNNNQSLIGNTTDVPYIVSSQSGLVWNGDHFNTTEAGVYMVRGQILQSVATANDAYLYADGAIVKTLSWTTSNYSAQVFYGIAYIPARKKVSIRFNNNCTLVNNPTHHHLTIVKINGRTDRVHIGDLQPKWEYDVPVTATNFTKLKAMLTVEKLATGKYIIQGKIIGSITSTLGTLSLPVKFAGDYNQNITGSHTNGVVYSWRCDAGAGTITNNSTVSTAGTVFIDLYAELAEKPAFAVNTL